MWGWNNKGVFGREGNETIHGTDINPKYSTKYGNSVAWVAVGIRRNGGAGRKREDSKKCQGNKSRNKSRRAQTFYTNTQFPSHLMVKCVGRRWSSDSRSETLCPVFAFQGEKASQCLFLLSTNGDLFLIFFWFCSWELGQCFRSMSERQIRAPAEGCLLTLAYQSGIWISEFATFGRVRWPCIVFFAEIRWINHGRLWGTVASKLEIIAGVEGNIYT